MKFKLINTELKSQHFKLLDSKTEVYNNIQEARRKNPGYIVEPITDNPRVIDEYLLLINYNLKSGELRNLEFGKLDGLRISTFKTMEDFKTNAQEVNGIIHVFNLKLFQDLIKEHFKIGKMLVGRDRSVYLMKSGNIEFRDTINKIPMTPHEIAENLNIESDFHALRITLQSMKNDRLSKLTIASDGLQDLKNRMGGETIFNKYFKGLTFEEDSYMRKSLRGGLLVCNSSTSGHGYSFDINSSFSYAMVSQLMPYGKPEYFTGKHPEIDGYPLFIQRVLVDCKIKDGFVPCITDDSKSYITDTLLPEELTLTSCDLEVLFKYYDVFSIEYIDGYVLKGAYGFFDEFVNYHYNCKKTAESKLDRLKSKLLLNTPYGKIGANPIHLTSTGKIEIGKIGRVDVSAFIASYARAYITEFVQKAAISGIFKYTDTDSVHVESDVIPEFMKPYIDNSKLGYFKIEREFSEGLFVAPKFYAELLTKKDKWKLTASGLNQEIAENAVRFVNFKQMMKNGLTVENYYLKLKDGKLVRVDSKFTMRGIK